MALMVHKPDRNRKWDILLPTFTLYHTIINLQGTDEIYDFKVDVFSLGLIFYELLWPFKTGTERQIYWKYIRDSNLPFFFKPKFPLETLIIETMLSARPENRPNLIQIDDWVKLTLTHLVNNSNLADRENKTSKLNLEWIPKAKVDKFIFENGKAKLRNKQTTNDDIFSLNLLLPDKIDEATSLLDQLKDGTVNMIMTRGVPEFFADIALRKLPSPYFDRKLCGNREVSSKILHSPASDLLVLINLNFSSFKDVFILEDKVFLVNNMEDINNDTSKHRVFLIENATCCYWEIAQKLKQQSGSRKSIHVLYYLDNRKFKWIKSDGSLSLIKKFLINNPIGLTATSENDFVKSVQLRKPFLIFFADKPGMGKSVSLLSLAIEINKSLSNFVVLFPFKDFIEKIKCAVIKSNYQRLTKDDVITAIQMVVSKYCYFEQSLVKFWLVQNTNDKITFHLMLDAIDEVNKKDRNMALNILSIIRNNFPAVRVWVTLNEHMRDKIEEKFSEIPYKILYFEERDQIKFVQSVWANKVKQCSGKPDLNLEALATQCVRAVNSSIGKTDVSNTPLVSKIIADIFEHLTNKLEPDLNDCFKETSLANIYKAMIEKKLERYMTQRKCIQNPDEDLKDILRKTLELRHSYLAIKLFFPDSYCLKNSFLPHFDLANTNNNQMHLSLDEQGIACMEPLRFTHETYACYFVALFIKKCLAGEIQKMDANDVKSFSHLLGVNALEVYKERGSRHPITGKTIISSKFTNKMMCDFLNDMLSDKCDYNNEIHVISSKIPDFDPRQRFFDCSKSFILASLNGNYFHLARYFLESLTTEAKDAFLEKSKKNHQFMIEISIRYTDVVFFSYISSMIATWHAKIESNFTFPQYLFTLALVKGKYDIFKVIVDEKGFGPEAWPIIYQKDKKKFGLIHHIVAKSRQDKPNVLEQKKKMIQYILSLDKENTFLEISDCRGRTPLLLPIIGSFSLKCFLVASCGANVNATGKHNNTVFHWIDNQAVSKAIRPKQYHELLEVFISHKFNQINLKNDDGCTPLHCAVKTYKDSLSVKSLEVFKNAGANFNLIDSQGDTVLHISIEQNCEFKFIKSLIFCGSDISVKNAKGQCALILAIQNNNFALVEHLAENDDFSVTSCDNSGKTVSQYASESNNEKIVNMLLKYDNSLMNDTK